MELEKSMHYVSTLFLSSKIIYTSFAVVYGTVRKSINIDKNTKKINNCRLAA